MVHGKNGEAGDGIQRRADVVGHAIEESGLRLAGLVRRLERFR